MESFGFDFNYDSDMLEAGAKGPFKTSISVFSSFYLELIVTVMLLITLVLFWRQSSRLKRLRETKTASFEKLIRLESPDDPSASAGVIGRAARDQMKQAQEKRAADLAELRKKISKSYIGASWYYSKNQIFYVLGLICYLIQAMAFNAVADLPALFVTLFVIGAYPMRREISKWYRILNFVQVYLYQLTLLVKLVHDVIVRIKLVEHYLTNNPETNVSKMNDLFFGGKAAKLEAAGRAEHYYIEVLSSLFFLSLWRMVKWWEIREKCGEKVSELSFIGQFIYYFEVREKSDQDRQRLEAKYEEKERLSLRKKKLSDRERAQKNQRQNEQKNNQIIKEGMRYDPASATKKKARSGMAKSLPTIILWTSRILLLLLCYTYHSGISFFNLFWVVFSFSLS